MPGSRTRTGKRLTEVFKKARENALDFDESSKFIFFSDSHRGDNGWADDFAHNSMLFFHALEYYLASGFTMIEVGDGDELWENDTFSEIRQQHDHIFWLMVKFHKAGRLHLLWGNHDIEREDPEVVNKHLSTYYDTRLKTQKELFGEISVKEGLVLKHKDTGQEIFVVHGHQGARFNDNLWQVGRFGVRHFWRHLQLLGVRDPTRPSQNIRRQHEVEDNIAHWICQNQQPVICGHTHRSSFPSTNEVPYFNTGSSVHPRAITGVEIDGGEISLIKWWVKPTADGTMVEVREVLVGPKPLADFRNGPWKDCPV